MNNKNEILRKIVHIVFGVLIILGFKYLERSVFIWALFILFLLTILFTLIHMKFRIRFLENFTKGEEKKFPLKGSIFFIVGCALVIYIFSKNIALASIAVLTFGDSTSSLASYFGTKYNLNPFRKYKSLLGTFVGIVVAFLFCLLFVDPLFAIVGSFFGMLSESLAIKLGESDADDNLIVPLAAAVAMYLLAKII